MATMTTFITAREMERFQRNGLIRFRERPLLPNTQVGELMNLVHGAWGKEVQSLEGAIIKLCDLNRMKSGQQAYDVTFFRGRP